MSVPQVKTERHPCGFTPAGADEAFCQRQSGLLRNANTCQNCGSKWRICSRCIVERTVDLKKSRVVESRSGLCARHVKPADLAGEPETVRDRQLGQLDVTGEGVVSIPLELIRPRLDQPRQHFDQDELNNLALGLKRVGQQQPAIVVSIPPDEKGHRYELDDGERRWRAARLAGLSELKCTVVPRHLDEGLRFLRSAVANFNRADHTLLEEVDMVIRLHEREGFSQRAIAEALGKHPMWVTQRYSLRRLHKDVRAMMEPSDPKERKLSFVAAQRLAVLHPDVQKQVAPSMLGVGTHEMTQVISKAARHAGATIDRRTRAPSDDFRSILRGVKTAAERVELIVTMDEKDWDNAFRHEGLVNQQSLSDQVRRLEVQTAAALARLKAQLGIADT